MAITVVLSLMESVANIVQLRSELWAGMDLIFAGIYVALSLIPGLMGNIWRAENLTKRGYKVSVPSRSGWLAGLGRLQDG